MMRPGLKLALLAGVFLAVFSVTLVAVFFAAMVLAGPHTGILPAGLPSAMVWLAAAIVLLAVPVAVTRLVKRKLR